MVGSPEISDMSIAKSLSEEQIATIQSWADAGAGLSDIQARLSEEMDVKVTYMEMRFLVDDIGIQFQPEPDPEPEEKEESETDQANQEDNAPDSPSPGNDLLGENDQASGSVTVTVDQVQRPGAIISGQVTFSGGQSASWFLDEMGRLGMDPRDEDDNFQPSESDLMAFQEELQKVIKESGF